MNLFTSSKYTGCYDRLVSRARQRKLEGYTEDHHVIPVSLGGLNTRANIVTLTAREHFIAHKLLAKMTTGDHQYKMIKALHMMLYDNRNKTERYLPTGRIFEHLRKTFSESQRTKMLELPLEQRKAFGQLMKGIAQSADAKEKISKGNKGKIISLETRQKASISNLGKIRTDETKQKIGLASAGRKMSIETRASISTALQGRKISDETKAKMRQAKLGKKATDETRKAMSLAKLGIKQSEETKKERREQMLSFYASIDDDKKKELSSKISSGKQGKPNGHKGAKRSEETKEKMRLARIAYWAQRKAN